MAELIQKTVVTNVRANAIIVTANRCIVPVANGAKIYTVLNGELTLQGSITGLPTVNVFHAAEIGSSIVISTINTLYSYDAATLTAQDSVAQRGDELVVVNNKLIVANAGIGNGAAAYDVTDGEFTLLGTVTSPFVEWESACLHNGYIIFADQDWKRLWAFSFDGSEFSSAIATIDFPSSEVPYDVWSDGSFIYCGADDVVLVYTFSGTAFSYVTKTDAFAGSVRGVYAYDGNLILCDSYNSYYYTFDGSTFTLNDSSTDNGYSVGGYETVVVIDHYPNIISYLIPTTVAYTPKIFGFF